MNYIEHYKMLCEHFILLQLSGEDTTEVLDQLGSFWYSLTQDKQDVLKQFDAYFCNKVKSMKPKAITSHHINAANKTIDVSAIDCKHDTSSAHSIYKLEYGKPVRNTLVLPFQNGPVEQDGTGANGITHEALIAILIDRLTDFQYGPFKCQENEKAIECLENARKHLLSRTLLRQTRQVEGTHNV